jgi:GR25 family glycosyltransferase involved in LPS biosynthesis
MARPPSPAAAAGAGGGWLPAALCISVADEGEGGRGAARWARMVRRWRRARAEAPGLPQLLRLTATTPATLPPTETGGGLRGASGASHEGDAGPPAPAFAPYLSPAQRACAWSHRRAWQWICDRALPLALVLEDDAVLRRGWEGRVRAFLARTLPRAFDMLLLNAAEEVLPAETWLPARGQCLAGAYVLSLRGARELLHLTRDTVWAADWSTQLLQRRGLSWTLFPWLAVQEGADSFLQEGGSPDADAAKVRRLLAAHAGPGALRELYLWEESDGLRGPLPLRGGAPLGLGAGPLAACRFAARPRRGSRCGPAGEGGRDEGGAAEGRAEARAAAEAASEASPEGGSGGLRGGASPEGGRVGGECGAAEPKPKAAPEPHAAPPPCLPACL